MKIGNDEIEIRGRWELIDGKIVSNKACSRIEQLIKTYLKEISRDSSGWDVLYQDPSDGRYWELLYMDSHLHGGGPPALIQINYSDAVNKYKFKQQ